MRIATASLVSLFLLFSLGCSKFVPTFYRLDLRQGMLIDSQQVRRLQAGMSKRQVQDLLGTPPITDPFNQQRWDYVYIFYPQGDLDRGENRRLTLFFEGDSLSRISADNEPESTPEQ